MSALVVADIGGTHARFALFDRGRLGEVTTLPTADYPDFGEAYADFARAVRGPLPRDVAIAAAGPMREGRIALTNASWVIDAEALRDRLGLARITLLNDFAAVAYAAAGAGQDDFRHLAGPDRALSTTGTVTVLGPGTGLGIAAFHRHARGMTVIAGEGGHIGFAPQDPFEDGLLDILRARHRRVVTEHVVAGPGIARIYETLGGGTAATDRAVWTALGAGGDALAEAAADRFCAALGSAAGDYALVHGAVAVVLAGGLAMRLASRLHASQFAARFLAKPHYETMMADMPVKLLALPQPGLLGAAAAFAQEHAG